MQINFYSVHALEVAPECFTVVAKSHDGRRWHHDGPNNGFAYFTAEQAVRLADRVRAKGRIHTTHWTDGKGGYYGTSGHEAALVELERFYERF
jgi:hypothetical protein